MIRLIREMRESQELQIVLCSHLLRDVEECCDEVMILKQGRLVHYANLEEERRANLRFLELEIEGDLETFAASVEQLGCECATSLSRRMKVVLAESVEVRDIYRLANEQGVQLRRVNFRRDSLEDIFLKAMETNHGGA
jgi:ABC-2 type transport system ATP-binding protein